MRANKPDPIGGVLWFGVDDANMAVFTPVYCCATKAPVCYTRVDGADYITFSWNSAFWIFNWVSIMVYPRYSLMIDDVRNSIGQPAGVIRPGYPKEFLEEYVKQTGKRYEVPE